MRLQEALLHEFLVRYLYPFSPFFRRHLDEHGIRPNRIRRLEDLQQIPPVSAADFARSDEDSWQPFRTLLRPEEATVKRRTHRQLAWRMAKERLLRGDEYADRAAAEEFKPVHMHPSFRGGPVVGYTFRDLTALSQTGARAMAVIGATRASVLASTLPFGPDLPFWSVYYAGLGTGMTAFHFGAGEAVRPSQAAEWMHRVGVTTLVAQPAYAEGLLRGAPPAAFRRLRTLVLWAAGGMAGARARFALLLRAAAPDAAVTTLFGIPEARAAWAECPSPRGEPEASFGYHTYPDLELLEVADRDGSVVPDGEPGELLYTSLDWRGSALLRYRTGLFLRGGMTRGPCPGCRRTVPRIDPDISRLEWRARVRLKSGETAVDLADVLPLLWRTEGVLLWQVELVPNGATGGADRVNAYLAGPEREVRQLGKALARDGVKFQSVPFPELTRRMGVGLERPEVRVVVRPAAAG